tara:strand:+ start:371 stop:721 length:351 start_codon:yes stop_codon:yes gene_type:complete
MLIKMFLSLVAIIFSILMFYVTIINYKKKIINQLELLIWSLIWIGIISLSIRPDFIDDYFLNKYNTDIFYLITVVSIIFLLIFCYFNMIQIKIIEKKINTIIRAEALKKIINKIKK